LTDDAAVAAYLLRAGRVASVPGAAYGLSPYIRISTATSAAMLAEATARIDGAIAALR
jgi:aspartate aminotransferase